MKVAIFVDALVNKGGFERIILLQAKELKADIYAGRYIPERTYEEFKKLKIKPITRFSKKGYGTLFGRLLTLYIWFKFKTLKLKKKYDCYILHGTGSLNASKIFKPNLWYCHAPSRYIYDLYEEEYKRQKGLLKLFYPFVTGIQRKIDQTNVKNINKILVNSNNVKARVKKFYNRNSTVVYPFVNTDEFKYLGQEDYYLSTGRLDRIKRVNLVIDAFKKMPEKRLIVASDGPEREEFIKIANHAKNITFLGYVSEKKLKQLYGNCIATLYLSYKEDFGMVPIESMAAGKPCIATNDGGFKETILHKKTGYLVDDPNNIAEVIAAVNWLNKKRAQKMRKACERRANLFNHQRFMEKTRHEINKLIKK